MMVYYFQKRCIFMVIAIALFSTLSAAGIESPKLDKRVKKVLASAYPEAKISVNKTTGFSEFKHHCRKFTVYRLNKTGEWQPPRKEIAPDKGGISVSYKIVKGKWQGANSIRSDRATVTTGNLYLFNETHIIKESAKHNCYLWAEILTPKVDPPAETAEKLKKLFIDFETYL